MAVAGADEGTPPQGYSPVPAPGRGLPWPGPACCTGGVRDRPVFLRAASTPALPIFGYMEGAALEIRQGGGPPRIRPR